ncbi:MAG: hypothetical protein L3J79_03605 [Candidatus Marinimicrobia bacterium]|nr:hypothetical protein [Candidatus Neomarinimicrobiota bacterium]
MQQLETTTQNQFALSGEYTSRGKGLINIYLLARMNWYVFSVGEAIRRYWQWLVLLVGFFFMVIDFKALVSPFGSIARTGDFSSAGLYTLWGIHLLGIGWIMMQRQAVTGGMLSEYSRTLALAARIDWQALLLNLVIANVFFWLYLSLAVIMKSDESSSTLSVLLALNTGILLMLTQAYWLAGKFWILPVMLVVDYLLVVISNGFNHMVAVSTYLVCGILLFTVIFRPLRIKASGSASLLRLVSRLSMRDDYFIPASLLIQHRALFKCNFIQTLTSWMISAGFGVFAWATVMIGGKTDLVTPLLVIIGGLVVLVQSGLFRILFNTHEPFQEYFRTLPVSSRYFMVRDYLYIALLVGSVIAPVSIVFIAAGYIGASQLVLITTSWLGLTALLLVTNRASSRHGVALSSLVTLLWCAMVLSV